MLSCSCWSFELTCSLLRQSYASFPIANRLVWREMQRERDRERERERVIGSVFHLGRLEHVSRGKVNRRCKSKAISRAPSEQPFVRLRALVQLAVVIPAGPSVPAWPSQSSCTVIISPGRVHHRTEINGNTRTCPLTGAIQSRPGQMTLQIDLCCPARPVLSFV